MTTNTSSEAVAISAQDAETAKLGSFASDMQKHHIDNYLETLGSAARFTGAIVGQTYYYKDMREVRDFDEKKPEYLIEFRDDKMKVNAWYMRNFMKRLFIDEHEDKGGLNFAEYMGAEKKAPVEFVIKEAIPRVYQGTENVVTSQRCWDFSKLLRVLGSDSSRHCKTFRSMNSKDTTQDMKADAYEELAKHDPALYLKDIYLENNKISELAKKTFVICDLVITVTKYMNIDPKAE